MIAADALPGEAGAYALTFRLAAPVTLPIATLNNPTLGAGTYVYAGSAFGPGGIRARVSRHLRAKKKAHWHIDHLSAWAFCIDVQTYPGGRECALVENMLAAGADVPVPGFGSSDCRGCPAHLVRLAAGNQNGNIADGIERATKQGKSDGCR